MTAERNLRALIVAQRADDAHAQQVTEQ